MIHYSCDRCGKPINRQLQVRYVVHVEVMADIEPTEEHEPDDDRDYLDEIEQYLTENVADDDRETGGDSFHRSFDLCPECYRKFVQNPLGCDAPASIEFSAN